MPAIRQSLGRIGAAFVRAFQRMLCPETPKDAASISYFILIALFPSVLVLIAVVDAILGWVELDDFVVRQIAQLFPGSAGLTDELKEITGPSPAVVLSCVIVVLWCSTWIFAFVEDALNRVWGVTRSRTFWESRMRSIGLMLFGGILLLTSAAITAKVTQVQSDSPGGTHYETDPIISALRNSLFLSVGFLIAILVFVFVYKLMPDRKIAWREAVSGAIAAALMWELGSSIFLRLLPYFDYKRVYGKTAAIIALLAWVYTSNLILLFGAYFSANFHQPAGDEERRSDTVHAANGFPKAPPGRVRNFPRR